MSALSSRPPGGPREDDRDNILAPLLACGALVLIAGLQLVLPGGDLPGPSAGLAARRQRPVVVSPVPEYAAILASPIFTPDRHPGASGGPSDTGSGTLANYAALGVATGRSIATGVVSAPGGAVKTVRRGDEMDGWRLVAVDRTRLIFERNGARHALVVGAPAESTIQAASGQATAADPAADQ